ncbi:hypothetical protein PXO_03523 [Xanthomonas oryzae pv. oryzae PXO99A]|uniref:Uncharacterized protein n=1 Tax=Xanthomonas oryzae pv. oryzae (strain PXO99A) TaxID=360094 RepID=A0A0K0GRJ1_XANOP|nr:hypothetical protein PXO_03523 [Xanthomonas oryzae pv. oryzae PXO99A]
MAWAGAVSVSGGARSGPDSTYLLMRERLHSIPGVLALPDCLHFSKVQAT